MKRGSAVGDTFAVNVNVDGVSDLYAWQLDLTFDPTLLAAVSVSEGPIPAQLRDDGFCSRDDRQHWRQRYKYGRFTRRRDPRRQRRRESADVLCDSPAAHFSAQSTPDAEACAIGREIVLTVPSPRHSRCIAGANFVSFLIIATFSSWLLRNCM